MPVRVVTSASMVGRERGVGMLTVTGAGPGPGVGTGTAAGVGVVFDVVPTVPVDPAMSPVSVSVCAVWPALPEAVEAVAVAVEVTLDDDTGNVVTDVLKAAAVEVVVEVDVAVDVAFAVAAPPSVAIDVMLEFGDSAFKMSVTWTKKNPSTTGSSFDKREFRVLWGLPVFSDLP